MNNGTQNIPYALHEARWVMGFGLVALALAILILAQLHDAQRELVQVEADLDQLQSAYQAALAEQMEWTQTIKRARTYID